VKHPLPITVVLVFLFVVTQLIGMSLVFLHADKSIDQEGQPSISYGDTAIGARPVASPREIFLVMALGITIGTIILLLLIKFKAFRMWKIWFFMAVFIALFIAFSVIIPETIAFMLAGLLALWKVFKPQPIVHNVTELFVYAGIVILIGPLFDLVWAVLLLILISIYDMYAVWKSKHMVTLAKASTENNMFAGLYIPKGKKPTQKSSKKTNIAVLGGGDVAFPLLFSAVVMTWLVNVKHLSHLSAFYETFIITICCTIALIGLFAYSKKGRFYPAMPFISAGCFIGFGIIFLL